MEINNLSYAYPKQAPVLNRINLTIESGKITTIIGPNGSGKSTLLSILTRHLQAKKGTVILDKQELHQFSKQDFARKLAALQQENIAPGDYTVKQLVMYGRLPHQHFLRKTTKDEKIVQQALQQMKLVEKQESLLAELSGGERQRAWLAMALAQETEYLILDEPTTYLDLTYQIELLKLIQTLNQTQKLTIIMVLHDLNQASQYSDEIIIMHHGEISAKGTPNEVITPRMLQDVYGVSGELIQHPSGRPYILPY
ncbi:ABC transporter ATP-binding protein [Carnobacterium divergens]|uniref:ABC transporter ATP-binding protein n=1 Tax=Carnobacterium divergens TaxID=2748 RepID=UPI0039AF1E66